MNLPNNFEDFQEEVEAWGKRNFPNNLPYHPLLGVVEEVGELSHSYLKRDQKIRGAEEDHTEKIKDAVGDICVYLADFCARNNMSLSDCIKKAWGEVRERDWIKFPKNGKTE